jgi:hypothetical protein
MAITTTTIMMRMGVGPIQTRRRNPSMTQMSMMKNRPMEEAKTKVEPRQKLTILQLITTLKKRSRFTPKKKIWKREKEKRAQM